MGLFSRKQKSPRESGILESQSTTSFGSSTFRGMNNRASAGSMLTPNTPLSPMPSIKIPKIDLPRPPDPQLDPAGYLRSLTAVRERAKVVLDKAQQNDLVHFDVDMNKFPDVVTFVSGLIKRDYEAPFQDIPSHGRYQHFCVGGRDRIAELLNSWPETVDNAERCRRLIDLFLISVLLDAGAGTTWTYKSVENGKTYRRSEGVAVASLEMFKSGIFSASPTNKHQVDKRALGALNVAKLATGMQADPDNELVGLEGRTEVLVKLAEALEEHPDFFGADGRPGNMIAINGVPLGDAWPCEALPRGSNSWESILPFHNLTQWLAYSIMQPMQSLLNMHFAGTELLTGLPEYRNGGLFVDLGVLTLKEPDMARGLANYGAYCKHSGIKAIEVAPMFEASDDVIVEWRGLTVALLDKLLEEVNVALEAELDGHEMTLSQLLEAGSWKGGREIAEINRPNTKEAPILVDSDGTVV
ncbi:hypothetical protein TrVGV298_000241 [Trichoderma virens]|nr:hypothetical protein TrVGV298_000241 [Trichoderma virens]